jgi:hypothetical protein
MRYQSPAFTKLQNSVTPTKMQDMLNTMSMYKIYTTLGISDKLLEKYISHYNLSATKSFKTIHDLSKLETSKIIDLWTKTNTSKRAICKEFDIGSKTLNRLIKEQGIENRNKAQIDKDWLQYQKIVLKLTAVIKRHHKLQTVKGFDWDHKFSVRDGYFNKVSPNIIASIENLELIPLKENRSNGEMSSISLSELLELVCHSSP